MIKYEKLYLITIQIWTSLIFNYFVRIVQDLKIVIFSFVIITSLIYLDFWPNERHLRIYFIFFFMTLNTYYFFKILNINNKRKWPTIYNIIKVFQRKLNLKNNELRTLNDRLIIKRASYSIDLWEESVIKSKSTIEENYKFKFKYFLLSEKSLSFFTSLSLVSLIFLGFLTLKTDVYEKLIDSISFQPASNEIIYPGLNIWVYPPEGSQKKIIFLKKNEKKVDERKRIFVENNSKILINFFNVSLNDINIKLNRKKINNNKNTEEIDFKTIKYEEELKEGEYSIFINNKVFYNMSVILDKKPKISYISFPKILEKFILNFSYKIVDENTKKSWLEISSPDMKNKKINLKKIDKIFSKPSHLVSLRKDNKKVDENSIIYNEDISHLPIFGRNLDFTLNIIDDNNQIGKSRTLNFFIPKIIFYDPLANQLIKIRDELFFSEDISKIRKKLKNLDDLKKSRVISSKIKSLNNLLLNIDIGEEILIEKSLLELWRLSFFVENNSVDALVKKIQVFKEDLNILVAEKNNEEKIKEKMNQLELLIRKYLSITNAEEKIRNEFEDNIPIDSEAKNENKKTILKKAEDLISRIDNILNRNKESDELVEKIISNIQKVYKLQKNLLNKSYNYNDESSNKDELLFDQNEILEIFNISKEEILKLLPNENKIIGEVFSNIEDSLSMINKNEIKKAIETQVKTLGGIKKIYEVIRDKSVTNEEKKKSTAENSFSKGEPNVNNTMNLPLIFESNNLNKIIEKIRKMSGEEDRKPMEKDYLKRLLPDF